MVCLAALPVTRRIFDLLIERLACTLNNWLAKPNYATAWRAHAHLPIDPIAALCYMMLHYIGLQPLCEINFTRQHCYYLPTTNTCVPFLPSRCIASHEIKHRLWGSSQSAQDV